MEVQSACTWMLSHMLRLSQWAHVGAHGKSLECYAREVTYHNKNVGSHHAKRLEKMQQVVWTQVKAGYQH